MSANDNNAPVPIGRRRFKVAKRLEEPSKYAVMRENEELRRKSITMAQLLAAVLMELPPDKLPLVFDNADLECIHPHTTRLEFGETTLSISLQDPESEDDTPNTA
jgi:hypothetical protein